MRESWFRVRCATAGITFLSFSLILKSFESGSSAKVKNLRQLNPKTANVSIVYVFKIVIIKTVLFIEIEGR